MYRRVAYSILLVTAIALAAMRVYAGAAGVAPTSSLWPARSADVTRAQLFVRVANYLTSTVTEYPVTGNGDVAPVRTLGGSHTGLHHPIGIVRQANGNAFVVNSSYPPSITEYAATASGNAAPLRTIRGPATGLSQPLWIALDRAGNIYVSDAGPAPGGHGNVVIFAANAVGNATPLRVIGGPHTTIVTPEGLSVTSSGTIIVITQDDAHPDNAAVLAFASYASGDAAPLRRLGASHFAHPLGFSTVRRSPDAWISDTGNGSVSEYAPPKGTELVPSVTLAGNKTGLTPFSVYGITVDELGDLFVGNRFANPNLDKIERFAPNARGNAAPVATITGPHTGLFGPSGMYVAPR